MATMLTPQRLTAAYERARADLLAACEPSGHWVGQLSSSALSTATAISALSLVQRNTGATDAGTSRLVAGGVRWLVAEQNADGGWGDTDQSLSNIATTMLSIAALSLAGAAPDHAAALERAEQYVTRQGGVPALRRRYGRDKTFAAPILANCALAGQVSWAEVPPLPFELACLPTGMWKAVRMPVVSYAIPALVAIGQARYHHRPPRNPVVWLVRRLSLAPSLRVIESQQPASGGYLEAVPLTSFVVMSLASIGQSRHAVAVSGTRFLVESVRADGSWPIDTNLATWNTTLAVNALHVGGEDLSQLTCWDWLLDCQHREVHAFTKAEPGGWAWTDLSGGVPDADDTAGALLALAAWSEADPVARPRARTAARAGLDWLLNLQNRDGGWPTFCRGWGQLPFDRSGCDLTAHALRALHAWQRRLPEQDSQVGANVRSGDANLAGRIARAIERGLRYLNVHQSPTGSWEPLWFGNQYDPAEQNLIYGTARVLLALGNLDLLETPAAKRGISWLVGAQNSDGGWGAAPRTAQSPASSSVEETAVAVEALAVCAASETETTALDRGLEWLLGAVETGRHRGTSPIGFYFAKLWYYESLYPLIFTVAALGQAVRRRLPLPAPQPPTSSHLHPFSRLERA
jgi:squalene-hopene/tetraprenyl-beta-curcumene cyclase